MPIETESPAARPSAPERVIQIPYEVADMVAGEITRAHLALTALIKLLRNGTLDGEDACLAHLLGYIEDGLERCDSELFNCMPRS